MEHAIPPHGISVGRWPSKTAGVLQGRIVREDVVRNLAANRLFGVLIKDPAAHPDPALEVDISLDWSGRGGCFDRDTCPQVWQFLVSGEPVWVPPVPDYRNVDWSERHHMQVRFERQSHQAIMTVCVSDRPHMVSVPPWIARRRS